MKELNQKETSAGRVINSSLADVDDIFRRKFGTKWDEYRNNWDNASKMAYVSDFPLFVRFETKFRCNLRCKMCVHGHPDLEAGYNYRGEMTFETYCELVDECSRYNCPSIGLNHANEPLLDKDIIERINYASQKGIMDIHLNTNAVLLNKEMSLKLLNSGLTRLCFSIDSATKETFNKIRIGANYEDVMGNIELFLRLKKQMHCDLPVTRVSMVLQEDNAHEVNSFHEYWLPKVDYVAIQRFVPISPFEEDDDIRARAKNVQPKEGTQRCSYPYESVFIHGDGTVLPCAAHKARKIAVGNVHKQSIHAIWHSAAMNQLREKHKGGDLSNLKLCQSCLSE
ncbi:MAG: SPASM domain-containing protein [Oscillospiraceae bacterium]|jgi:radical SAM protein with 4Fe4S-binding SPASM domain|nr:SPASM domain-containing protein [Oscillospiraceae bacterium]